MYFDVLLQFLTFEMTILLSKSPTFCQMLVSSKHLKLNLLGKIISKLVLKAIYGLLRMFDLYVECLNLILLMTPL